MRSPASDSGVRPRGVSDFERAAEEDVLHPAACLDDDVPGAVHDEELRWFARAPSGADDLGLTDREPEVRRLNVAAGFGDGIDAALGVGVEEGPPARASEDAGGYRSLFHLGCPLLVRADVVAADVAALEGDDDVFAR